MTPTEVFGSHQFEQRVFEFLSGLAGLEMRSALDQLEARGGAMPAMPEERDYPIELGPGVSTMHQLQAYRLAQCLAAIRFAQEPLPAGNS